MFYYAQTNAFQLEHKITCYMNAQPLHQHQKHDLKKNKKIQIKTRDTNRIVGLVYRYSPSNKRKQEFSSLSWLSKHLCQAQTSTEVIHKLSGRYMPFFTIIL